MASPFDTEHKPPIGVAERLSPNLRVVTAPNAGPMTFTGTRSYLYGENRLAVIDPGPEDEQHLAALLNAIGSAKVAAILVTHTHRDHSPLARRLSEVTSAPVYAFGAHGAGRSPVMQALASRGHLGGGEGADTAFRADHLLADGDVLEDDEWRFTALHTPGHISNHLCFVADDCVFSGDHVMGWATTMVSPPDGDLTQFYASLDKIAPYADRPFYPGHGKPVAQPSDLIRYIHSHRKSREAQILDTLARGPSTPMALTEQIYADVDRRLWAPASRNVLAHLVDLVMREEVGVDGDIGPNARYFIK